MSGYQIAFPLQMRTTIRRNLTIKRLSDSTAGARLVRSPRGSQSQTAGGSFDEPLGFDRSDRIHAVVLQIPDESGHYELKSGAFQLGFVFKLGLLLVVRDFQDKA